MIRLLILAVCAMLVTSCAVKPSPNEINTVDYGPSPSNASEAVKSYAASRLKDPFSAVYGGWTSPRRFWFKDYVGSPFPDLVGGWSVCFERNAKNSYGSFTGFATFVSVLKNGEVVFEGELSYFDKSNVFTGGNPCR